MVAHAIQLRDGGLAMTEPERNRPSILQLTDQKFIERLLELLKAENGIAELKKQRATTKNKNNVLRLFQPVHRIFHLALIDVSCVRPGQPRLDPAKIVDSGMVIRRLTANNIHLGWMKSQGKVLGWRPLPTASVKQQLQYDPSPDIRRVRRLGSNANVLSLLEATDTDGSGASFLNKDTYEEDVTSMFSLPPDICKKQGKTFLYGVIPTASSEHSEKDTAPVPFDKKDILERLPAILKAGDTERINLPPTGTTIYQTSTKRQSVVLFLETLTYFANEVGLFTNNKAAKTLIKLLQSVKLPREYPEKNLGIYLEKAYKILIERQTNLGTGIATPSQWPKINKSGSGASEDNIVAAIEACMLHRWGNLEPAQGRFDDKDAQYVVRTFVRVQDQPDCPPTTIWSEPSEPFEIVPWYESGGQPPVQVELPEINSETLSNLKPNVAFKVPQSVQKFMDKIDMGDLMDGKSNESDTKWGMICGFSIPIITLCAFIFLQIFLSLLNILFFWLPFIKICIPFPKKS